MILRYMILPILLALIRYDKRAIYVTRILILLLMAADMIIAAIISGVTPLHILTLLPLRAAISLIRFVIDDADTLTPLATPLTPARLVCVVCMLLATILHIDTYSCATATLMATMALRQRRAPIEHYATPAAAMICCRQPYATCAIRLACRLRYASARCIHMIDTLSYH